VRLQRGLADALRHRSRPSWRQYITADVFFLVVQSADKMNRRVWNLGLCLAVLVAVMLLAAMFHDVHFDPGRSVASTNPMRLPIALPLAELSSNVPLWKILLFWIVFAINGALFFILLPAELRRRLIRQLLSFSIGALGLMLALRYRVLQLPAIMTDPAAAAGQSPAGQPPGPGVPAFHPPQIPPWATYLVSLAALWLVSFLIGLLYRRWRKYQAAQSVHPAAIARIAGRSLSDLAGGHQWGDVVIESYARMSETVSERRGLQRGVSTTPREFVERLERAGLPGDAVASLTRLFESVRYGGQRPSDTDVSEASACLESILRACGGSV